jgi:hypothetical protein
MDEGNHEGNGLTVAASVVAGGNPVGSRREAPDGPERGGWQ